MTNKYETDKLYSSFVDAYYYNHSILTISKLLDRVKMSKDFVPVEGNWLYENNPGLNTFWSILVLMFGDYGVSPNVGWLTPSAELISFLEDMIKDGTEDF